MRIRLPLGLTKDQFYVVLILGTITGFYNWKSPLQEHLKEQFEEENKLNEVSNLPVKTKNLLIHKFSTLGLVIISGALIVTCARIYVRPWYLKRKYGQAEKHANIVYELQKTKILQEEQNES